MALLEPRGSSMTPKLKKDKKMTPTTTAVEVEKKIVKRVLFNLADWTRESREKTITVPQPLKTFQEVLAAVNNDAEALVPFYNAGALKSAIKDAKREMGGENLVSPKIVSTLLSGEMVKFPLSYTGEDKKKLKAAREEQREKVYNYVRGIPELAAAYKMIALAQAAAAPDDEDGEDEDDS